MEQVQYFGTLGEPCRRMIGSTAAEPIRYRLRAAIGAYEQRWLVRLIQAREPAIVGGRVLDCMQRVSPNGIVVVQVRGKRRELIHMCVAVLR